MGTIHHHALVATTWSGDVAANFREWVESLPEDQRVMIAELRGATNGYTTFVIGPDGSKEGWEASRAGDDLRAAAIGRLRADEYTDGSSPWDWIEAGFGELGLTLESNCGRPISQPPRPQGTVPDRMPRERRDHGT